MPSYNASQLKSTDGLFFVEPVRLCGVLRGTRNSDNEMPVLYFFCERFQAEMLYREAKRNSEFETPIIKVGGAEYVFYKIIHHDNKVAWAGKSDSKLRLASSLKTAEEDIAHFLLKTTPLTEVKQYEAKKQKVAFYTAIKNGTMPAEESLNFLYHESGELYGYTPLAFLAANPFPGYLDLFKRVYQIQGYPYPLEEPFDKQDAKGQTALSHAVMQGNTELLSCIEQLRPDYIRECGLNTSKQAHPMELAVKSKQVQAVEWFLSRDILEYNSSTMGYTPFIFADDIKTKTSNTAVMVDLISTAVSNHADQVFLKLYEYNIVNPQLFSDQYVFPWQNRNLYKVEQATFIVEPNDIMLMAAAIRGDHRVWGDIVYKQSPMSVSLVRSLLWVLRTAQYKKEFNWLKSLMSRDEHGRTSLIQAINSRDLEAVKRLLNEGIDPHIPPYHKTNTLNEITPWAGWFADPFELNRPFGQPMDALCVAIMSKNEKITECIFNKIKYNGMNGGDRDGFDGLFFGPLGRPDTASRDVELRKQNIRRLYAYLQLAAIASSKDILTMLMHFSLLKASIFGVKNPWAIPLAYQLVKEGEDSISGVRPATESLLMMAAFHGNHELWISMVRHMMEDYQHRKAKEKNPNIAPVKCFEGWVISQSIIDGLVSVFKTQKTHIANCDKLRSLVGNNFIINNPDASVAEVQEQGIGAVLYHGIMDPYDIMVELQEENPMPQTSAEEPETPESPQAVTQEFKTVSFSGQLSPQVVAPSHIEIVVQDMDMDPVQGNHNGQAADANNVDNYGTSGSPTCIVS